MLFRNARLFHFDADAEIPSLARLEPALAEHPFVPCSRLQGDAMGFVPAAGEDGLVVAAGDALLLRLRRQQKVLPAAALNERLEDAERAFEARTGRRPGARERRDLKDELRGRLLPGALTRSTYTWLCIDPAERALVVDAAGAPAAERAVDCLRNALGSLTVTPWEFPRGPATLFSRLLLGERIEGLWHGEQCVLRDPLHDTSEVRYRNADLDDAQLRAQLRAGMVPSALELIWRQRARFVMHADAALTRLRSLEFDGPAGGDERRAAAGAAAEEPQAPADDDHRESVTADFLLLQMTLRGILDDLARVLG